MKNAFTWNNSFLNAMPAYFKVLIGICLLLFSYSVTGLIGIFTASLATGLPMTEFANANPENGVAGLATGLKIIQVFLDLGLFVIPAFLLPVLIFNRNPVNFMGIKKPSGFILYVIAICLALCIQPVVDLTARLNQQMSLPHFLSGLENTLKALEAKNEALMLKFLAMPRFIDFAVNVVLVAILPAVVEELFFRGFVQKALLTWLKNGHLAVFIAAFIFSFIHLEFYGFLPRLLLGMMLGYAYLWSGDVKLPIIMHFTNNLLDLVLTYYQQLRGKPITPDTTSGTLSPWAYVFSVVFMVILFYVFRIKARTQNVLAYESDKNEQ